MKSVLKKPLIGLAVVSLVAGNSQAAVVFFDDFENGSNNATLDRTTGGYSQTSNVSGNTYAASNTSRLYNTTLWVDTTVGFGSDRQGLINENAVNETAVLPVEGGSQAYAFRYTNSGVTSALGTIGSLAAGQTITVTFDIFTDAFNAGNDFKVYLTTFNGGARNDMDSTGYFQGTTSVLAGLTGTTSTTDYTTVSFSYTVGDDVLFSGAEGTGGTTFNSAVIGHDIAIRFDGQTDSASWDNVSVDISAGIPEPGAALLGSLGMLALLRRRR